jgi:hypothetical protein
MAAADKSPPLTVALDVQCRLPMTRNVEIKARVPDFAQSTPARRGPLGERQAVPLREHVVEVSASGPELLVQRDTFYTVLQVHNSRN